MKASIEQEGWEQVFRRKVPEHREAGGNLPVGASLASDVRDEAGRLSELLISTKASEPPDSQAIRTEYLVQNAWRKVRRHREVLEVVLQYAAIAQSVSRDKADVEELTPTAPRGVIEKIGDLVAGMRREEMARLILNHCPEHLEYFDREYGPGLATAAEEVVQQDIGQLPNTVSKRNSRANTMARKILKCTGIGIIALAMLLSSVAIAAASLQ